MRTPDLEKIAAAMLAPASSNVVSGWGRPVIKRRESEGTVAKAPSITELSAKVAMLKRAMGPALFTKGVDATRRLLGAVAGRVAPGVASRAIPAATRAAAPVAASAPGWFGKAVGGAGRLGKGAISGTARLSGWTARNALLPIGAGSTLVDTVPAFAAARGMTDYAGGVADTLSQVSDKWENMPWWNRIAGAFAPEKFTQQGFNQVSEKLHGKVPRWFPGQGWLHGKVDEVVNRAITGRNRLAYLRETNQMGGPERIFPTMGTELGAAESMKLLDPHGFRGWQDAQHQATQASLQRIQQQLAAAQKSPSAIPR